MSEAQVGIIGGGVIGSSIAHELSKYNVKAIVFEKGGDVSSGASKANSGVIHSGINSPPGTLKAQLCVQGNLLFTQLAPQLSLPIKNVGKLIVAQAEEDIDKLELLKEKGKENNVPGLRILDSDEVAKKEKKIRSSAALWVPTASITLPYLYTISLAENAVMNGIKFYINTEVREIQKKKNDFIIKTNHGEFTVEVLINAAGINCREIVAMVEKPDFDIFPCRGQYLVLDKKNQTLIHSMVYPLPDPYLGVLGIHITPTIEGPILLGPSAEYIKNPQDTQTTMGIMTTIINEAQKILPTIPQKEIINAFSGIRCKLSSPTSRKWEDFRIEESRKTPGMINLLGIESPGLTAAPAIAKKVTQLVSQKIQLTENKDYNAFSVQYSRQSADITPGEHNNLIKKDNTWGSIICRCEQVTEAEVIKALSNNLNAQTLSSVKYRCRAGMGRCQGGFCTQHIVRILQEKFHIKIEDMRLNSPSSFLFAGKNRGKSNE